MSVEDWYTSPISECKVTTFPKKRTFGKSSNNILFSVKQRKKQTKAFVTLYYLYKFAKEYLMVGYTTYHHNV